MTPDLLDLYRRASAWTVDKVSGATDQLDSATPCDEWDVRTLLNHMVETQHYFLASGRGEDATRQADAAGVGQRQPGQRLRNRRDDILTTYSDPAVIEKTGPALGIAFSDALVHGWDVARATVRTRRCRPSSPRPRTR